MKHFAQLIAIAVIALMCGIVIGIAIADTRCREQMRILNDVCSERHSGCP